MLLYFNYINIVLKPFSIINNVVVSNFVNKSLSASLVNFLRLFPKGRITRSKYVTIIKTFDEHCQKLSFEGLLIFISSAI